MKINTSGVIKSFGIMMFQDTRSAYNLSKLANTLHGFTSDDFPEIK